VVSRTKWKKSKRNGVTLWSLRLTRPRCDIVTKRGLEKAFIAGEKTDTSNCTLDWIAVVGAELQKSVKHRFIPPECHFV